ncbi:MAG TPA: S41 family peptidase [Gemmatimonadaceae bacterium]|nr:S41 family peptidase [Gemmatimonadaceae bacterium]
MDQPRKLKSTISRRAFALAAGFMVMACAGTLSHPGVERSTTLGPGVALATFDTLWSKVSKTYVDTAFVAGPWSRVRDSLRSRATGITSRDELDALLKDMLATIPDSHFYIVPAAAAGDDSSSRESDGRGTTGLALRMMGGQVVVWRVDAGGPAATAGIRAGSIVEKVGEKDVTTLLRRIDAMPEKARQRAKSGMLHGLNGLLSPAAGDSVVVRLAKPALTRALVAVPAKGRVSQFGNLPPMAAIVSAARVPLGAGSGCAGMIAFNIWLPELSGELERAVDSVATCSGVVLDLRGNPGGLGAMVMGFGGYFVDSTLSLGTMRTRQVSLRFAINPRRSRSDGSQHAPFTGPLAILVDGMTASTSEIFASGMQRIGRARVFGERTAGAALPALMERLPSGDVFVHAVADFTDPRGARIEGAGVVPDETVMLSEQALTEGRDTALEAAVRWIGTVAAKQMGRTR